MNTVTLNAEYDTGVVYRVTASFTPSKDGIKKFTLGGREFTRRQKYDTIRFVSILVNDFDEFGDPVTINLLNHRQILSDRFLQYMMQAVIEKLDSTEIA